MLLVRIILIGIMAGIVASPATASEASSESVDAVAAAAAQSGNGGEPKSRIPFVEVQTARISTRYNFVANDRGVTLRNHQQHKEAFNFRFLFDGEGQYSLNMMAGSGSGFTSSWDALGIGSDATSNLNFREFFLSLNPWRGLEV